MAVQGAGWVTPFLALALAGCLGGSSSDAGVANPTSAAPTGSANGAPNPSSTGAVEAPVWAKGDWWTYEVQFALSPTAYTTTIVAIEEVPGAWRVSGTDREANLLAEFTHYPTLGNVQKNSLDGVIHGTPIPFFKWPLENGKTWNDPYRTVEASWSVTANPQPTGDGTIDGFDLQMAAADGQTLSYGYSSAVGWFTHLEHSFGGSPGATMKLQKWGHNFTGTVPTLAFKEYLHRSYPVIVADPANPPAIPPAAPGDSFTSETGETLGWSVFYGGAVGSYGFGIAPATPPFTGSVQQGYVLASADNHVHWGEIQNPLTGPWVAGAGAEAEGPAGLFMEVLGVKDEPVTL